MVTYKPKELEQLIEKKKNSRICYEKDYQKPNIKQLILFFITLWYYYGTNIPLNIRYFLIIRKTELVFTFLLHRSMLTSLLLVSV